MYMSAATNLCSLRSILLAKRDKIAVVRPFFPRGTQSYWDSNRNTSAWTVHINAQAE